MLYTSSKRRVLCFTKPFEFVKCILINKASPVLPGAPAHYIWDSQRKLLEGRNGAEWQVGQTRGGRMHDSTWFDWRGFQKQHSPPYPPFPTCWIE